MQLRPSLGVWTVAAHDSVRGVDLFQTGVKYASHAQIHNVLTPQMDISTPESADYMASTAPGIFVIHWEFGYGQSHFSQSLDQSVN